MKIRKNGKVITLSESDLRRIVKRVINEGSDNPVEACFKNSSIKMPAACNNFLADGQSECVKKLEEMITLSNAKEIVSIVECVTKKMGGDSYRPKLPGYGGGMF